LAGDIAVANNPERKRYEAREDGRIVGTAEYQLTSQLIVFTHTEVDRAYEGQGIGSALAQFALEDVRAAGTHEVLPLCPFIKAWIERHPEYLPLVFGPPPSKVRD
jgi:predicted GNAT family acetyltransferase